MNTFYDCLKALAGLTICLGLVQCVVPINTSFENASTLEQGEFELMGGFCHYAVSGDGETNSVNNNFSARIGYGTTDAFDLKLRYTRLVPTEDGSTGVNYLALAPKMRIVPDRLAATMPIGAYFAEGESEWFVSPKILFTQQFSDHFETTLAAKADIFWQEGAEDYIGFNLGFGMSSDLSTWAVRPELGLLFNPGDEGRAWSFGVGVTYIVGD